MAKTIPSPTLAETAYGQASHHPVSRMVAGFAGFAVALVLILATAFPVAAHRGVCALPVDGAAVCTH